MGDSRPLLMAGYNRPQGRAPTLCLKSFLFFYDRNSGVTHYISLTHSLPVSPFHHGRDLPTPSFQRFTHSVIPRVCLLRHSRGLPSPSFPRSVGRESRGSIQRPCILLDPCPRLKDLGDDVLMTANGNRARQRRGAPVIALHRRAV